MGRETQEMNPASVIVDHDVEMLKKAGKEHGIRDFEGRTKFGLDPAAMLTIDHKPSSFNKEKIDIAGPKQYAFEVAETLGADPEQVWSFIHELHEHGPWANAERLAGAAQGGDDAEAKTYLTLAAACREDAGRDGFAPDEYVADRERVLAELQSFTTEQFPEKVEDLKKRVAIDTPREVTVGGETIRVPIAEGDAALPLAMQGFEGCVTKAGELRFAQTERIDDSLLEAQGLTPGFAEVFNADMNDGKGGFERVSADTEGGRVVWVAAEEASKDVNDMSPVAKRIAPGYMLTYENEDLAVSLIATAIAERHGAGDAEK